jgi:2-phospho-L-lactate guanylyltransferase
MAEGAAVLAQRALAGGAAEPFRPWALIAAKRFGRAKARLSAALPPHERRALASAMFERVLRASTHCAALCGTLVVTDGDDVAARARRRGASVLRDRADAALSEIVDAGFAELRARGATHALVLMADLPLMEAHDVTELLGRLRMHDIVLVPDATRRGTSALGVRLAAPFQSAFGHDDSFSRHLRRAAAATARRAVHYHPRVAFDVDTAEDLARWRQTPACDYGSTGSPSRTQ